MADVRERITLKFWMAAGEMAKLAGLGDAWFDRVQEWLESIISHVDPDTAAMDLVELLGWQRDVERLPGESDELLRHRVKDALANAKDAGSVAGFARIFARLQLGAVGQAERVDPVNWDVIELEVDAAVYAANQAYFDDIIRKYGRTCRRYSYTTQQATGLRARTFDFDNLTMFSRASA